MHRGLGAWVVFGCVFILPLVACEDTVPQTDASSGPSDLRVVDAREAEVDAGFDASPDLRDPPVVHGVRCGDGVCYDEAMQYCHTTDWGQSGVCVTRPAPGPGYYACDGTEDCQGGACCYLNSASVCSIYSFCVSGSIVGEFVCHTDVECGQLSRCCPLGSTGSYRTCVDGLAPTDPCPMR